MEGNNSQNEIPVKWHRRHPCSQNASSTAVTWKTNETILKLLYTKCNREDWTWCMLYDGVVEWTTD